MQVGPANGSGLHAHQHVGRTSRRHRDRVHLQAPRGLHLPQRFHRRRHLLGPPSHAQALDANTPPWSRLSRGGVLRPAQPAISSCLAFGMGSIFFLNATREPSALLLISPVLRLQSSRAPSNTRAPIPGAPVHILPKPHHESLAHSASHRQNSALHRRIPRRRPTIPRSSPVSASLRLPLSHDPQGSHTQTPPEAPLARSSFETESGPRPVDLDAQP